MEVQTVYEINQLVQTAINKHIKKIKIRGEISSIKISNGNSFLSVRDEQASINITAWGRQLNEYKGGDDVIITGYITVYVKSGSYQVKLSEIEKTGDHTINIYETSKKIFEEKGYFSKKRSMPQIINRIGIITAIEGAAIHDVLYVLQKNKYRGDVLIKNCFVQGKGCPSSVADSIREMNERKEPIDVILITRGGGSVEDLMGYSSAEVVEAIYNSNIYTISAIGHEVDFMLSDFSADCRAPTPSVAGELMTNAIKTMEQKFELNVKNMDGILKIICSKLDNNKKQLTNMQVSIDSIKINDIIDSIEESYDDINERIKTQILANIANINKKLDDLEKNNNSYALNGIIIDCDNNIITSKKQYDAAISKNNIRIIFDDGVIEITPQPKKRGRKN